MNLPALAACLLAIPVTLLTVPDRHAVETARQAATPGTTATHSDPGERVFSANCSRCHTAPMSLSPRVTGTVILHMRTRARLSQHDEQLLLKFLAP